jgi:hypothetical protein
VFGAHGTFCSALSRSHDVFLLVAIANRTLEQTGLSSGRDESDDVDLTPMLADE